MCVICMYNYINWPNFTERHQGKEKQKTGIRQERMMYKKNIQTISTFLTLQDISTGDKDKDVLKLNILRSWANFI